VADIAVQRLAGHTTLAMTDRYTHIDEQHRDEVADALESAHHAAVSDGLDQWGDRALDAHTWAATAL